MCAQSKDEHLVEKAVTLSIVEIVLGSLLHTLRLPFSGQFLSLNQGFFLTRSIHLIDNRKIASKSALEISMIVAIMKSLSPAGKKFGPMMSIGMQGLLYSLGLLAGGNNLFGQVLGMILLSSWAFLQPFITYFIIYGPDLFKAFQYFIGKLNRHTPVDEQTIWLVVSIVIGIKLFIAIIIPFAHRLLSERALARYDALISKFEGTRAIQRKTASPIKGTISDITRPFFLFSMLIMISFFVITEPTHVRVIWKSLRIVAVAFIFFYLTRSPKVYDLFMTLSGKSNKVARIFELSRIAYKKLMSN